MNLLEYLIIFVLIYLSIYFLVALHELGHYYFAKKCGFQILAVKIGLIPIFNKGIFSFGLLPFVGDTTIDMTDELFEDKNQALKFALRKAGGIIFQIILLIPCLIIEHYTKWFPLILFNTLNTILLLLNAMPLQYSNGSITDGRGFLISLSDQLKHKPVFTRETYAELLDELEAEDLGITVEELRELRLQQIENQPHKPTQQELEAFFSD